MKRLLALILCVLMLAALFPISALANEDEGDPCAEGHTYTSTTTATCTAAGSTTYTCSVCGYSYSVDAAALGHNYNAVVTEPTCTAAGFTTYRCARCGDSYQVAGDPALGHDYDDGVVTAPTCTAAGYTTYSCTRAGCDYSYTEEGGAALGHSLDQGVITAPTCTEDGYTTYSCTREGCSYTCREDGEPSPGHDYECAVNEETGVKTYTCTRCNDTYTESVSNESGMLRGAALQSNRGLKNISTATVAGIPEEVTYTGSWIKPVPTSVTITIGDDTTALTQGTDYTLAYGENTEIGEGTVVLRGQGDYEGSSKTVSFNITRIPITIKVKDQTYIYEEGKQQGEGDPAYNDRDVIAKKITITSGSLLEGDYVSSIVLSGSAENVGVYEGENGIIASSAAIKNGDITNTGHYNITYAPGKLTILSSAVGRKVVFAVYPTNDAGDPEANPEVGTQGTEVTLTPNPASGYNFSKWEVVSGGVTITDNKFTFGSSPVVVIKAIYEAKPQTTYTVSFNIHGHGSAQSSQTVVKGGTATNPGNLSETGWTFNGWYTSDAYTTKFDFNTAINADTTIHAKWTENIVYTVTKGEYTRWWKGGIEGVSITVKRSPDDSTCYSHFTGVAIDDTILAKSAYTAKKGSTVVYLKPETLQKLHRGYHDVTILFDDGYADATVRIYSGAPKTGDSNDNIGNWLALLLLSGFGFGSVVAVNMKKKARRSGRR